VRSPRFPPITFEQMQKHRIIAGLRTAVYDAYKGDAQALLSFLRSDLSLTHLEAHRELLADLIERRVQFKRRGQRGAAVPTRAKDTEQYIVALCRSRLKQTGRGKGAIAAVVKEVGGRLAEDGELNGLDVDWDRIKKTLRPSSTTIKK
jgi:hypothetical protein